MWSKIQHGERCVRTMFEGTHFGEKISNLGGWFRGWKKTTKTLSKWLHPGNLINRYSNMMLWKMYLSFTYGVTILGIYLHFNFLGVRICSPWRWESQRLKSWLGGGNSNIFHFHPVPGEMIQFDDHIFQMGSNHQLIIFTLPETNIWKHLKMNGWNNFLIFLLGFWGLNHKILGVFWEIIYHVALRGSSTSRSSQQVDC